jgi:hypothetical protein
LPLSGEPLIGAAAVHDVLLGWRTLLQAPVPEAAAPRVPA